ncbi:hypothetical protein PIB30_014075 [Stylosanthes scabra]|uniref:Uncharacterized protein n=1 Tax=Stylosanthes scabra TaxID=79078 RepID=A0ABU6R5K1_9FABA|nr:hypothetical protein [Stylosanthes scabra]
MQGGIHHSSSIREKFKSMCCFKGTANESSSDHADFCNYDKLNIINTSRTTPKASSASSPATTPPPGMASALWFKRSWSAAGEHVSSEILPRVRGHSFRKSHRRHNRYHNHRQTQSADFSYDPSSYALNFENEDSREFPLRCFSARLPASPPRTTSVPLKCPEDDELAGSRATAPSEIAGYGITVN